MEGAGILIGKEGIDGSEEAVIMVQVCRFPFFMAVMVPFFR